MQLLSAPGPRPPFHKEPQAHRNIKEWAPRRGRGCCFQPGQKLHSKDHRRAVFIVSDPRVISNPNVLYARKQQENGLPEAPYTTHTLHCITATVLPPLYYRKVPASKKRLKITTTLGRLLLSGLRCRSASNYAANTYTTPYARVGVTQPKSSKLPTEVHQGSDDEAALPRTWFTTLDPHRLLYNFS